MEDVPEDPSKGGASPLSPCRDGDARALVGPYGAWPYVDRRNARDRRGSPTRMWSWFALLGGRRAVGRRRGEDRNIYVDRYARGDLAIVGATLILNILDAWLTLVYLGYGGTEANPVAKKLLSMGVGWFVGAKCAVVAGLLLFLAFHKTFAYVRTSMRALCFFYLALLAYHVYLQIAAISDSLI